MRHFEQEKKAHENWVAARQAERKLNDLQVFRDRELFWRKHYPGYTRIRIQHFNKIGYGSEFWGSECRFQRKIL
jgi:hypothetical protein